MTTFFEQDGVTPQTKETHNLPIKIALFEGPDVNITVGGGFAKKQVCVRFIAEVLPLATAIVFNNIDIFTPESVLREVKTPTAGAPFHIGIGTYDSFTGKAIYGYEGYKRLSSPVNPVDIYRKLQKLVIKAQKENGGTFRIPNGKPGTFKIVGAKEAIDYVDKGMLPLDKIKLAILKLQQAVITIDGNSLRNEIKKGTLPKDDYVINVAIDPSKKEDF